MKYLILIIAMLCLSAEAKCLRNDSWKGSDKNQHLVLGGVVGFAGTLGTNDPWKGLAIGAGVGALKELSDSDGSGTCSLQDFLVTVAGAGVGSMFGNVVITHYKGKTTVQVSKVF